MDTIDKVLKMHAAKNPAVARVLNHMKEFASKTSVYHTWVRPPQRATVDYFFKK